MASILYEYKQITLTIFPKVKKYIFEKVLSPGEQIEPVGWLYKDPGVWTEMKIRTLWTGFLAGMNIVMNRFTGPGRPGTRSMYLHMPSGD